MAAYLIYSERLPLLINMLETTTFDELIDFINTQTANF